MKQQADILNRTDSKKHTYGILLVVFFIFCITLSQAQSFQRQTIASAGDYTLSLGTLIRETIGQPYSTQTFESNEMSYRPGFQQPALSLELIASNLTLKLFPNPAATFINMATTEMIENVTLRICDNNGKLVMNENIGQLKSYQIDCAQFLNGLYMITVSTPNSKSFSAKLIINR